MSLLMTKISALAYKIHGVSHALLRFFKDPSPHNNENLNTEDQLTLLNEVKKLIPKRHHNQLLSIFDLEDVNVDHIMVARNEINGINVNDDWKSIMAQLTHAAHSRIVLYRDEIDNVVGILRVREAYRLMVENTFSKEHLLRASDEVYFIPEGTPLKVQLLKFQRNKERIGLIVNEYGDIIGLITLEDILEAIVAEFSSAFSPRFSDEINALPDGSYIIEGSTHIRELNKRLHLNLPTDGSRTINGLILEHLEDIPNENIPVEIFGLKMEIIEVAENMIKRVKILSYPKK